MDLTDHELLHRFTQQRDAAAFAALVARHGPMVLATCRRVLRDGHGAEDALQATFLILAQKAPTIRERETMAHWLYQVAANVARRLRRQEQTRSLHTTAAAAVHEGSGTQDAAIEAKIVAAELRPIIDQELAALSTKLREVVVLCYLEGRTYEEAAAALRLTPDAVRGRLARARELLRGRLARRGLAVSAVVLGLALTPATAPAAVPTALAAGTAQLAVAWVSGTLAATAPAAGLAKVVLWSASVAKLKLLGVAALTTIVVLGAGVWAGQWAWRPSPSATPRAAAATSQPAPAPEPISLVATTEVATTIENTTKTPARVAEPPPAEVAETEYHGIITGVEVKSRRLMIRGAGSERTVQVPAPVPVHLNGRAVGFGDLRVGLTVELTYDDGDLLAVNAQKLLKQAPLMLTAGRLVVSCGWPECSGPAD